MIRQSLHALRCLSPNCQQVARLIGEGTERKLSRVELFGLKSHLLICRGCRAYRRSNEIVRHALRSAGYAPPAPKGRIPAVLPDGAKERISEKISSLG